MISKEDINYIKENVEILDVVQRFGVEMHRSGAQWVGRCPFHNEKDGSFYVRPSRNSWKCFGCQKGGNVIDFVIEMRGCTFVEAVKELADIKGHILTEDHEETEEEKRIRAKRASQMEVNKAASLFFEEQLRRDERAMEYCTSRGWDEDTLSKWGIGYAPADRTALYKHLRDVCHIKMDVLMESPLFRSQKGSYVCKFYERVMFPVFDQRHDVMGFSGRTVSWAAQVWSPDGMKDPAKYINSSAKKNEKGEDDKNDLYNKSELLFGWNFAQPKAYAAGKVVLVEGNPDTIKLHQIGVEYACAACGTAFTPEHAAKIAKAAKEVILLYDSDEAGQEATLRSGAIASAAGLAVSTLTIPNKRDDQGKEILGKEGKQDPDTFFTSKEQFEDFEKKNKRSWFQFWAENKAAKLGKTPDPAIVAKVMREIAPLIAMRDEEEQPAIIGILKKYVGTSTMWKQVIKTVTQEEESKTKRDGYSAEQLKMIDVYGFCMSHNTYHIQASADSGWREVSNFVLEPLFHIESTVNAKRLYRLRNNRGVVKVLEIPQKDLVSLSAFKTRVESFGNFLFTGSDTDLNKIKAYLYEATKSCKEIERLGWQKEGFFAWSNGLTLESGEFLPIDELGTVTLGKESYYMPALSEYYKNDEELFNYERSFINIDNSADLWTLAKMMRECYGDNAVVGLGFYLATLFRDIVFEKFGEFPLLNVFGQKNTGKTTMAMTLMRLFTNSNKPGDVLETTTAPGLAQNLRISCNSLFHIDEYKNSVEYNKIEVLKAIYNSKGRTRMNWEKGRQSETTQVDCGVILTGQEMPNADPALFRRLIYLTVSKTSFSEEDTMRLERLKEYEKRGLTCITNALLCQREYVKAHYAESYDAVRNEVKQLIRLERISAASLWKNWLYVLAMYHCLDGRINLPWRYAEIVKIFTDGIERQNAANMEYDEIGDFWHGVESMLTNGDIENDYDIALYFDKTNFELYYGAGGEREKRKYTQTYDVLYLNPDRLFDIYSQFTKKTKDNKAGLLGKASLRHYLTTSDSFLGEIPRKFKVPTRLRQNPGEGKSFSEMGSQVTALYKSSRALVFNYRKLQEQYGIDLDVKSDIVEGTASVEVPY